METTKQTIESYHIDQNIFDNYNGRERQENEILYHLKQMHRLLYILVNENKNKTIWQRIKQKKKNL